MDGMRIGWNTDDTDWMDKKGQKEKSQIERIGGFRRLDLPAVNERRGWKYFMAHVD